MTTNTPQMPENSETAVAATIRCKTCDTPFTGNFCPNCGQKVMSGRFTLRMLFSQLISMITNLDRGFWHTLLMLLTRPWIVLEDYLAQRTRPYYDPFRFLVIMTGVASVFVIGLGLFDYQVENMNEMMGISASAKQKAFQAETNAFMRKYFNIFSLLIIPFFIIAARWLFRSRKFNFAEFAIIFSFLYGALQLFSLAVQVPGVLAFKMNYNWIMTLSMVVTTIYYVYALKPVFGYSYPGMVWRAMLAQVLGLVLFMTVTLIIAFIIGIGIVLAGYKPGG